MYHVSAKGVDEHMINVHYYYYIIIIIIINNPPFQATNQQLNGELF